VKLLVDGMLADIARLRTAAATDLRDLREGWSAMLKGSSAAEVLALCRVFHGRLPPEQRWLAEDLIRHHPEAATARSAPFS
jgi:hypothetical protein